MAKTEFNNSMRFVLFQEDPESKRNPNGPDFTGQAELDDGRKIRLAGWTKVSAKGEQYISGQFTFVE